MRLWRFLAPGVWQELVPHSHRLWIESGQCGSMHSAEEGAAWILNDGFGPTNKDACGPAGSMAQQGGRSGLSGPNLFFLSRRLFF
jgi:hypothetical protein